MPTWLIVLFVFISMYTGVILGGLLVTAGYDMRDRRGRKKKNQNDSADDGDKQ